MATYTGRHQTLRNFLHNWEIDDLYGDIVLARQLAVHAKYAADDVTGPTSAANDKAQEAQAKALASIATSLTTLNELIVRGFTYP